ncbi:hypothetical protein NEF87_002984 [Candidatus Lokiarchaeum ossiferum]|uniref:Secondary thiamine-phosphate synthase enzyme n=2 Tax=Candidatus Lokiarchaeum ossiferum TaxID=2951803 RepID=A0ABY6HVV9_9ARCH|nr:hypothetical protein NEF87_002984 [Candidatus Lokiarchaeum sp. B-35]
MIYLVQIQIMIMVSELHKIKINTKVDEIVDITDQIQSLANQSSIKNGILNISCPGSTGGISCVEYEPGLINHDIPALLHQIAPEGPDYAHHQTWGDHNGHSHLRSFLIKPTYTVPVIDGSIMLGTWQQIIFCEFDEKPRSRTIYCQFVG